MLEWKDPPPGSGRGSTKWKDIANELKARPGAWAVVESAKTRSSAAGTVKRALRSLGDFDVTSRRGADGWDVYARFVGEVS